MLGDTKISIVTPSLNQGCFIQEAIESVLNQGYGNFEHIIIDGGSSDETVSILAQYSHLIWISEPDAGQSDAYNKGLKMAKGDLVGWLNADDRYLPDCFRTIAKFCKYRPEIDIVYGDYRWINEEGAVIRFRRELEFDMFMLKYLHVLSIHSASTFFRARIFDEGNLLNISYRYAMDYEFFLRIALKGYKFAHIKAFLADFRWHSESKSWLAAHKQLEEQEKALLEYDEFLRRLRPSTRLCLRRVLMWVARTKRYFLKSVKGYYLQEWGRYF